jgi:tRNA(fMet)-specific endonuclease VapC
MYCFDTDVLSTTMRRDPPLALIRRLAALPAAQQHTTAITVGELLYGVAKTPGAAAAYATLRTGLERAGSPLDDPDLRIASIALARELTLVTGNGRHFARVPGLHVEDWLTAE